MYYSVVNGYFNDMMSDLCTQTDPSRRFFFFNLNIENEDLGISAISSHSPFLKVLAGISYPKTLILNLIK